MILNCSINQLLGVWSQLEACYYNNNKYGGNVAEIYAYTLREDKPSHSALRRNCPDSGISSEMYGEDIIAENLNVGQTLVTICKKFSKDKDCEVSIEGEDVFSSELNDFSFDHRVHVKVSN